MGDMVQTVRDRLFSLQDPQYRDFNARLLPTVAYDRIIGVRTPQLRRLAAELAKTEGIENFLDALPHTYFEENNLHAFILESIKDFDEVMERVDRFLPYVDNWATSDQMCPKVFKKDPQALLCKCKEWIASSETYTVRYGIGMLMRYFLDADSFSSEYPMLVAGIHSEEYYVRMMQSWYFATALAKQYDAVLPYLCEGRLDKQTHNMTIRKAVESLRISPEQKIYLRTLKRK